MEKIIGAISLIVLGMFVILNPVFTARGGTTDLSYMNLNILIGLVLILFAILLFRKKQKDNVE